MFVLPVELRGLTASFRVPHMFKYHRSLPLPPYTSVIGLFGAAIGKDMATAQKIFNSLQVKIGIAGSSSGGCNDTWRVLTTKTSENDVVERQILYKPRYFILFCGTEKVIRYCDQAFRFPVYPLSLGRPDDLADVMVHDVFESEPEDLDILKNTVVTGTISAEVEDSLFDINDPLDTGPSTLLYRLPVHYIFVNDYTYERTADDYRDFVFIGNHAITLKEAKKGFNIKFSNGPDAPSLAIPLLEV